MNGLRTTGHPLIDSALDIAFEYSGFDGAHNKQWVIDQMVIALYGGEDTDAYREFVESYENPEGDEMDPEEYRIYDEETEEYYSVKNLIYPEWDKGISP